MTTQKTLKRRVRARMAKTGEPYTTARMQLLAKASPPADSPAEPPVEAAAAPAADAPVPDRSTVPDSPFRAGSGASDAALIKRTGHDWPHWYRVLESWGARERPHPEIARFLNLDMGVEGWWSQELTVRYEMATGRRVPGQRADGGFEVTASKTVNVPAERLLEAWIDEEQRAAWLPVALRLRGVNHGRSTLTARFDWVEPGQRIVVWCNPKGDRSTMALAHQKLPDADEAVRMKVFWKDAVAAMARFLERDR